MKRSESRHSHEQFECNQIFLLGAYMDPAWLSKSPTTSSRLLDDKIYRASMTSTSLRSAFSARKAIASFGCIGAGRGKIGRSSCSSL